MEHWITMPTGEKFLFEGDDDAADEFERQAYARHDFAVKYMKEQGWGDDVRELTIQQLAHIRKQEGWRRA